jgi:hypothetical protein
MSSSRARASVDFLRLLRSINCEYHCAFAMPKMPFKNGVVDAEDETYQVKDYASGQLLYNGRDRSKEGGRVQSTAHHAL